MALFFVRGPPRGNESVIFGWKPVARHEQQQIKRINCVRRAVLNPCSQGSIDPNDNCPETFNPSQQDGDGDGVGDVCDNCPDVYNPGQEDRDGGGIGDACDDECAEAFTCGEDAADYECYPGAGSGCFSGFGWAYSPSADSSSSLSITDWKRSNGCAPRMYSVTRTVFPSSDVLTPATKLGVPLIPRS